MEKIKDIFGDPKPTPGEKSEMRRHFEEKILTKAYLTGGIGLDEYRSRIDKLPKLDLVRLASRLNSKL